MHKPTICLDFDGVIHSYKSKWTNAHTIADGPVPGALAAIMGYLNSGFDVAIYSSRSKSVRGRWAMQRWLSHHLKEFFWSRHERVQDPDNPWDPPVPVFTGRDTEAEYWGEASSIVRHKITWPWFKPAALITIDDRAICFDGTWPSAEAIRAFTPWNKKAGTKT